MAGANRVFIYEGKNRRGVKTRGEISGANVKLAKAQLRRQGINPTRIRKKGGGLRLAMPGGGITQGEIALFTRQLATMMKAGVPLVQSFEIVAGGIDKPAMKALILKVRDRVSAGHSFAHAVKSEPEHFDSLFCNLVAAGERSGALETMLDRLADWKEKNEFLKARVRSALNYPMAVLAVACVVSGILLVKVVPRLEESFAGFGAELPELTRMLVNMSRFMQEWWLACLALAGGLLLAYTLARRRYRALREGQERMMLKLPILGDILNKSCVARFARTLSTTFAAGVPLVDALDSVAGAAGNIVYLEAINKVREEVSRGNQLYTSMKSTGVFPDMLVQMVAIGEESGALDDMLDKAATYYEEMVNNAVEGLTSLMEPVIMSVLGVIIGGLVIAMYLPLFSMGDAIGFG